MSSNQRNLERGGNPATELPVAPAAQSRNRESKLTEFVAGATPTIETREAELTEFIARATSFLAASETPFGSLLVHYKEARSLTNGEMARLSGLPLGSVGAYLTGRVAPPVKDAEVLASALGLEEGERKRFMTSAKRAKAWAQKDARPYIEERLQEIREHIGQAEKELAFARALKPMLDDLTCNRPDSG